MHILHILVLHLLLILDAGDVIGALGTPPPMPLTFECIIIHYLLLLICAPTFVVSFECVFPFSFLFSRAVIKFIFIKQSILDHYFIFQIS